MKLKTEMVHMDGKWSVGVVSGFSDEAQARARKDVSHDAMAAHAYKRELANLRKAAEETPRTHERQLVLNLLDVLDRRAAEILAGWMGEE